MTTRDKDELRAFGIPIGTVIDPNGETAGCRLPAAALLLALSHAPFGGRRRQAKKIDRYGYRTLSRLTFEPDELSAVVDAAARVRLK
jgi:predicted DNA-binding transcriptional regulator YafY